MINTRKIKNYAHLLLSFGANTLNGFPSKDLKVIGVTGTDGKTTTSSIIYHILREAGYRVAVISTLGAVIDGKNYETGFHVTTPSPFSIQKYIRIAKQKGCTHIVLEVTSHALDQYRVWGIQFSIGVLTNITHEHLDYHKDYNHYVKTKLKLFKKCDKAVINSNGEWYTAVKRLIPKDKLISYSLHGNEQNDISILNLPIKINTRLIGDFNLENIIAASITAKELGVKANIIESAIKSFEAPTGRQEEIPNARGITIMVDFAHTANAFENILPELRKRTTGRIIHVFGAAGERDALKRPEMGKAASFYDDIIVLTAEDPRSEEIDKISDSIREGILSDFKLRQLHEEPLEKTVYKVSDRKEAIAFALKLAERNDSIIITGKGHEKSMNLGHGEVEWSDNEAVRDALSGH